MRLIDDWRTVLRRSIAVWLGVAGAMFTAASVALVVFIDVFDRTAFFGLTIGCAGLGALCSALVPLARITKQKSISGGSDADQ